MNDAAGNLQVWRADLVNRDVPPPRPSWLTEAYADPAAFWEKIASELIAEAPGVPRSAVFEWYNLFHEFGTRHAVGRRPVHLDYNPATGFREETYAALTRRALALVTSWRERGVVPGAAVCIVLELSAAYVGCLLAAFYCGAIVTVLPPEGPGFVRRALKALVDAPKLKAPPGVKPPKQLFVVAGAQVKPWLNDDPALSLLAWEPEPGSVATPAFEPHRYDANASAMRVFSPLSARWDTPLSLSADQLYLSALRDGIFLLGLGPGQRVSAPGFCGVQHKPGLLFATLAAGATWVEIGTDELEDPSVLFAAKLDVLGVSSKSRDLIIGAERVPKGSVARWFRNIAEEDNATRAWTKFEASMATAGALGSRWFANSAAGGSILFSPWTAEPARGGVWRTPGLPCDLREPNGTGMPPLADVALLCPTASPVEIRGARHELSASALGRPVIATAEDKDIWVTILGSHRHGTILPERQIEELLQAEFSSAVRAAVLVVLPRHAEGTGQKVALLVYVRPDSGSAITCEDIKARLELQLGEKRVPDSIEIFYLNPKLREPKRPEPGPGEVDRAACGAQFISGTLWSKRKAPVFRELALLSLEIERIQKYEQVLAKQGGG